jgi:hypothetical protein
MALENDAAPLAQPLSRRVRLAWLVGSVLALVFMLNHDSDTGTFFGRYSITYALMLGAMGGLTLITAVLCMPSAWRFIQGWLARVPQSPFIMWGLIIGGVLLTMGIWGFLPGARHKLPIGFFSAYLTLWVMGFVLILLQSQSITQRPLKRAGILLLGLFISVTIFLLAARLVGRVPGSLFADEQWLTNWGWSMFTTGKPVVTMNPARDPAYVALLSVFYPVMGGWLTVTGVTFEAARLFWLLLAWLGVPFVAATGRRLYGNTAGFIAGVVALYLPLAHNYVRADMVVSTALAVALYCLVRAVQDGVFRFYVVAGFMLALSVEGHTLGLRFALAIGIFATVAYLYQVWRERRWVWYRPFWGILLGGLAYLPLYLFLHTVLWGVSLEQTLAAGQEGLRLERILGQGAGEGITRTFNLTRLWFEDYLARHPLEFVLFVLALAMAVWRWQKPDKALVGLFVVAQLILFAALPKHNIYYWSHHLPILALLVGAGMAQLVRADRKQITLARMTAALMLTGVLSVDLIRSATQSQSADRLMAVGYEADAVLPPDVQHVWGWQSYYLGLQHRQFINSEEFINPIRPDWMTVYHVPPPQAVLITRGLDDMHADFNAYIAERGMVVGWCFPLDIFQQMTVLYVLPEFAPPDAPVGCAG